ncbi:phage baseplate protein [Neopusillimonas maritima]|uniref:Dit-like phage tail protein N-terminal domain-containing protein n=1 Tax=Neopusillimonas maritima TaxID=2026239 RepID=A0A3A1YWM1_9BURK|nr:hypothetical protein [Neopusillimonas maritima]RIY41946.1 hypothetical protein CJP73_00420 [Neopusillimonas maritima]
MSIISIFTRQSPTIAGYQFDAVLEDSFEASVELTRYPVESGVNVADHAIIQPMKYYMVGSVSNNPLKIMDVSSVLSVGLSAIMSANPLAASVAGLTASFLAGTSLTRASSTLQFLIELMIARMPFDVDAVDIQLRNMLLTRLSRDRDPENENGLIFVAELGELVSLSRLTDFTQPSQEQLADGDPAKAGAAATTNSGQQVGKQPSAATTQAVNMTDGITMTPL